MPYQSTNHPRPILKRFDTSYSSTSSESPYSSSLESHFSKGVHFPGPENLEQMHFADSPDQYDRSPIFVGRNECAIPERGWRTYDDTMDLDAEEVECHESTPGRSWKNIQHSDHSHPRARIVGFNTRGRPGLIRDLSDTSEDSDSSTLGHQSPASAAKTQPHLSNADPAQLAFLPHPHSHTSPPSPSYFNPSVASSHARDARSQHRALSSPTSQKSRSRSRVRGSPVRERRAGAAEGIKKRGREREAADEGCLGGF